MNKNGFTISTRLERFLLGITLILTSAIFFLLGYSNIVRPSFANVGGGFLGFGLIQMFWAFANYCPKENGVFPFFKAIKK